ETEAIARASSPLSWRRATERDSDRVHTVTIASRDAEVVEAVAPIGAGRLRGLVLHKLMEEILSGELKDDGCAIAARATLLVQQLRNPADSSEVLPNSEEMAATISKALAIPEIAQLRPCMIPELPVYAITAGSTGSRIALSGRVAALRVLADAPPIPIDWK